MGDIINGVVYIRGIPMTKRAFTIEQDKEIAKLYQDGLSSIKLAKKYSVDKSTILNALKRQGVKRRRSEQEPIQRDIIIGMKEFGNRILTPSEAREAYKIYSVGGFSLNAISQAYGFGKNGRALSRAFDKEGYERKGGKSLSEQQEIEAVELYESGLSSTQVAKRLGVNTWNVKTALHRQGAKVRSKTVVFRYSVNQHAFDKIDTEAKAYWLGFIYADGSVIQDRVLTVSLARRDIDHLEKLKTFLKSDHKIYQYNHKGFGVTGEKATLKIINDHMGQHLAKHGIVSGRDRFNNTKSSIRQGLEQHFIRGYLDGDGCLRGAYNPSITFIGQYDILSWIRETFHRNLNTKPDMAIPRTKGKEIYTINYAGNRQARKITSWLYESATVWMERKRAKIDTWPS